jgi:3-oxoacyl-[acyl-carrier protein] reductase
MIMNLSGKVAILTGAGRLKSIGASTAILLAQNGCNILINCRNHKEQAEQVVDQCRQLGVDATFFMGDLTQESVCQSMAEFTQNRWGRADIIINSMGFTKSAPYEDLSGLTADDFSKMYAINATAPFLVIQAFQKMLKKSGDACIVNVSSSSSLTGKGSSIAYASSKGALNTLTLALAQALSPEVRVNAVCPSFVDSSWWDEAFLGREDQYKSLINSMQSNNLLNKVLTPIDVARTILSIIQNSLMTGEIVRLDAGAHIGKANIRI